MDAYSAARRPVGLPAGPAAAQQFGHQGKHGNNPAEDNLGKLRKQADQDNQRGKRPADDPGARQGFSTGPRVDVCGLAAIAMVTGMQRNLNGSVTRPYQNPVPIDSASSITRKRRLRSDAMQQSKRRRPLVEPLLEYLLTAIAIATAVTGALGMKALAPLVL